MIRLYRRMFEEDRKSASVLIPMASASTTNNAETELMIRSIYKETICPMICEEINRRHQNFLFMVKENFGVDFSTRLMTWNLCNTDSTSRPQSLQLKFLNGISTPVSTGIPIKGNEQKPLLVALVDEISGQIVTTGDEAEMEVEIVLLDGNSKDDEADNWTSVEFNDNIVRKWKGKEPLKGNKIVKLKEGIVYLDKISITHTSVWKEERKCSMGARSVSASFPTHVKEAKTESFLIMDKRKDLYTKHEFPSLSDPLYRVHEISSRTGYKRLSNEDIKTVMDLLTMHAINPQKLKDILKVSANKLKIIMNHANMCKDDKTKAIHFYRYPKDGQKINGVAFNVSGKLVGIVAESLLVPYDKLPDKKRADAQKLILSSSENWKEVVSFKDQDSFSIYLQSRPLLIPSSQNNLNVVIPQTTDPHNHKNLTSPKSQSSKRPASEHVISNSPKQARYDHPKLSPSTCSVGIGTSNCHKENSLELSQDDDDDYLKYLNLNDRWKIVLYVVGWISMISKQRKRRTTFYDGNTVIVIAASVEHAGTFD
ncbi:calmodulin-binding protein 60 A-like [Bidens hawaiensis]|uniref:calmodulin-binding protein 60 A-like n=1 Tax=Bidens hawaiensis TaxID=980011 RepID=UPI00404A19CF